MESKNNGNASKDLIFKQIQELLKKNKQQTQASLAALQKSMEEFNKAVLDLGLDAQHPMNPAIKNLSLQAISVLVNGLSKIPKIDPKYAQQALLLFKKIKQDTLVNKKIKEAEEKVQKLKQEALFNETANIRFAKVLKAAQLQSKQYPTTLPSKKV